MEFQQKKNNLLFEGIPDGPDETDLQCMGKLHFALRNILGLDVKCFKIDKCHCIDGQFKDSRVRLIICSFNWHYDVQCILKHRSYLPDTIFVSEDLPEEWIDHRKILKPIYNAAKRVESLKKKTKMSKDHLIIDGRKYSAAPINNIAKINDFLDVSATCQC